MEQKNNILDYWKLVMPDSEPRDSQLKAFEWIQNLPPNIKYLLLEMPVGGGKSPVGLTVSSWLSNGHGSSFILTPQKILQKQYEESFQQHLLYSMYGKSNYNCESKKCSCEVGSSIKPSCSFCPYKIAFGKAKQTPNMVLNYTLGLLLFAFVDESTLPNRKLIIMDECHNLESQLVNFGMLTISKFTCEKIGNVKFHNPENINDAYNWILKSYHPRLVEYILELSKEKNSIEKDMIANGGSLSTTDQKLISNYVKYTRHADYINTLLLYNKDGLEDNFVLINDSKSFSVKELYGGKAFHSIIEPRAEKFLFMSSTILNREGFCNDLQINMDESAFLSLDSEFKKENRMVFYKPVAKMNYGWDNHNRKADRTKMINAINNILSIHNDVSGIIHTGNFKLAKWLVDELQSNKSHYILHHNPSMEDSVSNRGDIISEFIDNSKLRPTILISPSITEGLDLKDDMARFAIFAKVPYPSLADAWIKRRMDISADWYRRQTLKEMIQGSGRICRSHNDWGVTYILDESFGYLYNMTKRYVIPEWWDSSLEII